MGKRYVGFAIRTKEKKNFFGKKIIEDQFCKMRIGANTFAEAQQALCDAMVNHNIRIGFIFPWQEESDE